MDVFQPILSLLNEILHLNTVKGIIRTWTITSLKSRYLPGFLKQGYGKKVKKPIRFDPYCPLKDSVWPISTSQGFLINFHQKLAFYSCFKHLLKNLNQRQHRLTHAVVLEKLDQLLLKTCMVCFWFFFNIFSQFWPGGIQFDPCCLFKNLIYYLFKDLIKIAT